MNYNQALSYIHSISWKESVPGLSPPRELQANIGNPEKSL